MIAALSTGGGLKRRIFWWILIVLLCLFGWSCYSLRWPAFLYPNFIRGELMDLGVNPDGTLWVLTDGTLHYLATSDSPGNATVTEEGYFCKTYLYHYDPVRRKVLHQTVVRFKELPNLCCLVQGKGMLWQVNRRQVEPWTLLGYHPITGKLRMGLRRFCTVHPELRSGLVHIYYEEDPPCVRLETKNGRNFFDLLPDGQVLPDSGELLTRCFHQYFQARGLRELFVFVPESTMNKSRMLLYRIRGSAADLCDQFIWPFPSTEHADRDSIEMEAAKFTLTRLAQDAYLEPIILYQDDELIVFLAQDQLGDRARRSLICIDAQGQRRWTVPPNELDRQLMLDPDYPFSTKDRLEAGHRVIGKRQGDLFVLAVRHAGVTGFDLRTGKKRWQVKVKGQWPEIEPK